MDNWAHIQSKLFYMHAVSYLSLFLSWMISTKETETIVVVDMMEDYTVKSMII
jgi:hypothetical protein